MSTKQVSVRLVLEGGQQVRAQLVETGREGARALGGLGKAGGATAAQMQNAAYQVGDFAVQIASGTEATRALAQQLPQLLGGFGLFGALAGAAVAAGGALLPMMIDTSDKADDLSAAIEALAQSTRDYRDATRNAGFEALLATFGRLTPEVIALQREMQALRLRDLALDAAEVATALAQTFDGFRLHVYGSTQNVIDLLGGTFEEARAIQDILSEISTAETAGDRLAALDRLQAAILAMTGGVAGMTREQAAFYGETLRAEEALRAAEAATGDSAGATETWGAAMSGVRTEIDAILAALSSLGGSVVANAAKAAELRALQAGKSVREAARAAETLQREASFDARANGANWFERMVIDFERGVSRYGVALDTQLDQEREAARTRERLARATRRGGRGGGARTKEREARELARDYERLLKVLDPLGAAARDYAEAQDRITRAQAAGLVDQDAANALLAAAAQNYRQARQEATGMAEVTRSLESSMEETFMSMIDGTASTADAFRSMASAVVRELLRVLVVQRAVAGILGVLGLGSGSAAAGLAGSVAAQAPLSPLAPKSAPLTGLSGIKALAAAPAAAAPAPRSAPAAQSMTINVTGARGNREIEAMVARGVQAGISEFSRSSLPLRVKQISADGRRIG